MKGVITITLVSALIVSFGKNAYAGDLHFNVGAAALTIIPTAFAELEYGKPGNSLRIHFSTSGNINPLSSKKYQAVLLQYEFSESKSIKNNYYYISAGRSETTGGSEREYDYEVLGLGARHAVGNVIIFDNFTINTFLEFFVNFYREVPVAGQTTHDFEALPGIVFGLQLF